MNKIEFEPLLSRAKTQLMTDMPLKLLIKFIIVYDKPYWKDNGYSGEIVCSNNNTPFNIVYDATTFHNTPALVGKLINFLKRVLLNRATLFFHKINYLQLATGQRRNEDNFFRSNISRFSKTLIKIL